jgi:hypothetical protein
LPRGWRATPATGRSLRELLLELLNALLKPTAHVEQRHRAAEEGQPGAEAGA